MKWYLLMGIFMFQPLFLEPKHHDKPKYDYNINFVLSHEWIDFETFKPEQGKYVLFYIPELKPNNIVVGKYVIEEYVEIIVITDKLQALADFASHWMLLPNPPKHD